MPMQNDVFLRAATGDVTTRIPLWLMRQAGRYLPEYNKVRSRFKDFLDLCFHPEALTEVTLQPLQRFDLDAGIIFSDILVIPYALGMDLRFVEGTGPVFASPLRSASAIDQLSLDRMDAVLAPAYDGIRLCRPMLSVPLIGFAGSPFTLACYLLEGRSSSDFLQAKKMIYTEPDLFSVLLEKLTEAVKQHLRHQVAAGVQAVMLFDSWGGILSTPGYHRFSLAWIVDVVQSFKQENPQIPLIVFSKGGGQWIEQIAASSCDVLALDWTTDLAVARGRLTSFSCALQGNLDPLCLLGSRAVIAEEVTRLVSGAYGQVPYIFNLGHGVHRLTPIDNVSFLIETVRRLSHDS